MQERKFEIPEFLKETSSHEISAEKAELYRLEDAYNEMFGDHDYTTIFIESDEDEIRILKKCLKEHRRFDDITGTSNMRAEGNFL